MNYGLTEIGIGITIGLQVWTAIIVWTILRKKKIITSAYLFLFIAVLLQVLFRLDNIHPFLNAYSRLTLQFVVSGFTMLGFAKILKSINSIR